MMTGTHFAAVGTLCLVAIALTGFIYLRHPFICNTKAGIDKVTQQKEKVKTAFYGENKTRK